MRSPSQETPKVSSGDEVVNPLNIPLYYKRLSHQDEALLWLWNQIPRDVLVEFSRRWRNVAAPNLETDPIAPRKVVGWENTTPAFRAKLGEVAKRLQIDPLWLAAIISFETGGTFNPSIRNSAGSGAVGLIQFMPETARTLGTSVETLSRMSAVEQLDWVEKYFRPYAGKIKSLRDAYMAVLWPAAVGKGPDAILFKVPSIAYRQNAGLDWNKDGTITAAEAAAKVERMILS